ncbi:hypothetical protein M426DRAFT_324725 [Hypoxylon sp. CI-4A]|nr:hypothetical protein M426DRAFT_324725 [Hypoxylon sp. CI-4A]
MPSSASTVFWRRQAPFLSTPFLSTLFTPTTRAHPRTAPNPTTTLLRNHTSLRLRPRTQQQHRHQSTKPPSPSDPAPSPPPSSPEARQTQRADAILNRTSRWVPRRLHPYLQRLRSAPFSHVAAFLVLHEATAIIPLFGLSYLFYSMDWVPTAWVLGPWAAWAEEGLSRYMRWFRKKGWFGLGGADAKEGEERLETRLKEEVEREKVKEKREGRSWFAGWKTRKDEDDGAVALSSDGDGDAGAEKGKISTAWHKVKKVATVDNTEKGYKIGIQIAAAYAITKMLLILRIALSLWATPWLARSFVAARRSIWKKRAS